MTTEKRKIILISALCGIALWIVDGIVDSMFFSRQTVMDSLLFNIEGHELYFRSLFLVSFILFGVIIANTFDRRKAAQEELTRALARVEEEKVRSDSIVAAIGDGISIQDRNLKIIFQNKVHMDMVGGDKSGMYCYQSYSNSDTVCEGCPVIKTLHDGGIHMLQKKLAHGDGNRTLEIKSSPLRDRTGAIVAVIEAVRDITERKQAQEKLVLFSKALEEAMDGIQIISLNGRVLYSNKAVQDIYGFSPDELAGIHVNDMNADKEYASQVIIPAIKEFGRWSGEVTVLHKGGHTFPIWLSTSLVTDDNGTPVAMVGIIRDMTDRKQSEELLRKHREQLEKLVEERTGELTTTNEKLRKEISGRERMEEELLKAQKLESIGILAGGIAHDFNNLLASILGNVSLAMLDLEPDHPSFRELAAAEKASLRAQDLTQQLLTFSKGGAPIKRVTDIGELIREASGFALRGSRIRCDIVLAADLQLVDVDEGQISQVIHNLVLNADHAMPSGGTVTIRSENVLIGEQNGLPLAAGDYVRISVEDKGVGISKDHIGKIFDPYFTTKQKGSGLGLAMTYSIIRKHGGHVAVESTLGMGTIFHVYLPAAQQEMTPRKAETSGIRRGSGAILVMDDEAEVRETTGNILKRLGYVVAFARDGEETVDMFLKARESGSPYNLVIMDLTVPGAMGGKEAIKKLLQIDPQVKAIVSSGYSNDPIMAEFRQHGFSGVVTKPFRLKDLSEEVARVLNRPA